MKKSKFLCLFSTLKKKEINAFETYLHGLYAKQENAILLFTHIKNKHSNSCNKKMQKDYILKHLFNCPSPSPQNRKNIDNLLSKLFGYLNEFLLLEKIKQKKIHSEFQLLEIYKERKLDVLFFQKTNQLKEQLTELRPIPQWENLYLMLLGHETFYHTNFFKIKKNQSILENTMKELDRFYCKTKLKLSAEMLNRELVLQEKYDILFLDELMTQTSTISNNDSTFDIYFHLIPFLKEPSPSNYKILKEKFYTSLQHLTLQDQNIILSYLLNYISSQIKQGNINSYQEAFELYKFGLDHNIFINQDGFISSVKFNNIIVVCCNTDQIQWAEDFIRDCQKYLDVSERDTTVKIATAYLHFNKKDYEQTIKIISSLSLKNSFHSIRARSLVLKSYYEIDPSNKNLILDYSKAFTNYLDRNKTINSTTLIGYKSFIELVKAMLKDNVTYEILKRKIESKAHIVSKTWLLEKIEEFQLEHNLS